MQNNPEGTPLSNDNAMRPEEVREARDAVKRLYGDAAFQPDEVQSKPAPVPTPKLITSADIPRAPEIEPEDERTMLPHQVRELRRQAGAEPK